MGTALPPRVASNVTPIRSRKFRPGNYYVFTQSGETWKHLLAFSPDLNMARELAKQETRKTGMKTMVVLIEAEFVPVSAVAEALASG